MTKTNIQITRYRHDDFFVDIIVDKANHHRDAWLTHRDYGVSVLMFGEDVKQHTHDQFIRLVELNLDGYIKDYMAEYMWEG